MARRKRVCPAGVTQHVIQRGNNRQACFYAAADYAAYAHWLQEFAVDCEVAIHAWVFMDNHVHLLATPQRDNDIAGMMQRLGRCYVRYFNHRYGRSGTLWEGRYRSCLVDSEHYLLACYRYIELNPVRAGIVASPAEYHWSSYRANALGIESRLRTPHPEYIALDDAASRTAAYRAMFPAELDEEVLADIRAATHRGVALGSRGFVEDMERATGTRLREGPMGRPAV